ncbi:MAG: hypothetical protein NC089_06775 [Bacteroides sp.]|nr:hypothetical protein [Bacteroides sp.]MCM1548448.1 hypothetical protein [Clostridium sp.]
MKEQSYFPFERNRYFYGKLLSVEDFQREQSYMNHKRRLLNRLLYGPGILCGMQVIEVDPESISIEMGVALDGFGREVVLEQPVLKRLSVLDGFQEHCVENENSGVLYLCIEYKEEETEPVHCIGASGNEAGNPLEFNMWKEGCHLFLTSEEPNGNEGLSNQLYEEIHTVFSEAGIRIRQVVPRFLQRNREAVLRLLIDKRERNEACSFQFEVELTGASVQGRNRMTLEFREEEWEPADSYQVEYILQAGSQEMEGGLRILPDSFLLKVGEHKKMYPVEGQFRFQVITGSREQAVWNALCQEAPEDILLASWQSPLYLARITVIQAGEAYVIQGIDNLPYQQLVWNNRLLGSLQRMKQEGSVERENAGGNRQTFQPPAHTDTHFHKHYAYGTEVIDLGIGGEAGQCFFSKEIIHGLGPGRVFIQVGIMNSSQSKGEILYGARDIFPKEPGQIKVETAVKVNQVRGCFSIGIRCLEEVQEDRLLLHWMAVRGQEETEGEQKPVLTIRPNLPRIHIRETLYLEALVGEEPLSMVRWEIKDAAGGSITEKGLYTAPNQPGIYEIRGTAVEDADLQASVYVIVAEEQTW